MCPWTTTNFFLLSQEERRKFLTWNLIWNPPCLPILMNKYSKNYVSNSESVWHYFPLWYCFLVKNKVFSFEKQSVSPWKTKCFSLGNRVFFFEKHSVLYGKTLCFLFLKWHYLLYKSRRTLDNLNRNFWNLLTICFTNRINKHSRNYVSNSKSVWRFFLFNRKTRRCTDAFFFV